MKKLFSKIKRIFKKDQELDETSAFYTRNNINKVNLKDKKKFVLFLNIGLSAIMVAGIGSLICVIGFMLYIILRAPDFNTKLLYDKEATVIYDANGKEFARIGVENRELVEYEDLPQVLVDAIVATEDSRFFQHDGFDIARFTKAAVGQVLGHRDAGGASTLTMQIIKNTFTSRDASIVRKFTDIYMAIFKLERKYTKEDILTFYVNQPWLGEGTWGVEQACQTYFGKSVRDLSLTEAALLAGMFQAPASYDPFVYPKNAEGRRNTVLNLMYRHGYITEEERDIAKSIPVQSLLTERKNNKNKYQDFIDTVVEDVIAKTGNDPYNIPMEIYTTMNPDVQDVILKVQAGEGGYSFVNNVVQVGIAVTDTKNGAVVAIGAGRNRVGERQLNRATMIERHPGSTAKPIFDYGPYIEYNNGSTYSSFLDEPMKYSNGTSLKNADGTYLGLMTMRNALVKSRNIPAVTAFQQVDKDKIADFAHSLGMHYGSELFESCAIGGFDGTNPLEMSAAYAAFGRGGYYIEPYTYTKIHFLENDETVEYKYKSNQVMSDSTAYLVTNMLTTAGAQGVGGNIKVSGTEVAAKTGTSTMDANARAQIGVPGDTSMDNWVNVYSPDYSISLWYGYDVITKDYYTTSISAAGARKKIMAAIANKILPKNSKFKKPSSVVSATVELETFPAQLASEYTPSELKSTEYFKKGTEPAEVSTRFDTLKNPKNGKATATGNQIIITWDPIDIPQAYDSEYLNTLFTENYGEYADKYYQKRIDYNNANIGNLGYQVYLDNGNGNITPLGFTTNNSFTYTVVNYDINYTFIVKSSFSIFKNNQSSGLSIKVSDGAVTPVTPQPVTPSNNECNDTLSINDTYLIKTANSAIYNDSIKVVDSNNNDISSKVHATPGKKQKWDESVHKYVDITNIDTQNLGTYQIAYSIEYKECKYNVNHKIVVQ